MNANPTPDPISDADLAILERLEQQATPRPWRTANGAGSATVQAPGPLGCAIYINVRGRANADVGDDTVARWQSDAALIAAARNAIPGLIARVRKAEAHALALEASLAANNIACSERVNRAEAERDAVKTVCVAAENVIDHDDDRVWAELCRAISAWRKTKEAPRG